MNKLHEDAFTNRVGVVYNVVCALEESWSEQVDDGSMTTDELVRSLQNQVSGEEDMSMDECTDQMKTIMGWPLGERLSESHVCLWRSLVRMTAMDYLNMMGISNIL